MVVHAPSPVTGRSPTEPAALLSRSPGGLSRSRRRLGFALAVLGLPLLTALLVVIRGALELDSVLLLYLLAVVVVAVVGGLLPGLLAALLSFGLANFFLTPPYYTFAVAGSDRVIELVVYVVIAAVVSVLVDLGARHRVAAFRSHEEAQLLSALTATEAKGTTVNGVLEQVRAVFAMQAVALVRPRADGPDEVLVHAGELAPGEASLSVTTRGGLRLVGHGPQLFAEDTRLLRALADTAARIWEEQRIAEEAARAHQLAEIDKVRSGLLAAVSHDLRTPLANIKANVSSLRQDDVDWTEGDRAELLASIEESADRLNDLIHNLLAMSRLQAGAVSVHLSAVQLDEVVARALLSVGDHETVVDVAEDLSPVLADGGLLERVVANLATNARRYSPPDAPPRIAAARVARGVQLTVADHGPGIPEDRWNHLFEPFQRLGDTDNTAGLGLGLAIAGGFADAMGATLTPSRTPGGGLTMTMILPVAP